MPHDQSIPLCVQAVARIDNYLLASQKAGKYDQWLDRYSKTSIDHDDKFLFGKLVQAMFSGGMKGEVVDRWIPRMQEAFHGWDVLKISRLSGQDVENLINSGQVIANKPKLAAVVQNAKLALILTSKYGSFGKYLASFKNYKALSADLQQFKYIKEVTTEDYLRNIGFDTAKPDRHIIRWLTRMNAVDGTFDVDQILKIVYTIAEEGKMSRARFDSAIYLFCADRTDVLEAGGICGFSPQCSKCPINDICPRQLSQQDSSPSKHLNPKQKKMETKSTSSPTPKPDDWTVWNTAYRGKSLEDIKLVNPFAIPSWLDEPFDQKRSKRIKSIESLFSGSKNASMDRINELGRNDGRYVAFRAIVLGYAIWDGKTLLRTNKSFLEE